MFNSSGDANHIKDRLEECFPKLRECGGFEILRFQGRIDPLKTIVPPRSGYSVLVGETRYALSEESYVSPRAVGYSSCAVAFWG